MCLSSWRFPTISLDPDFMPFTNISLKSRFSFLLYLYNIVNPTNYFAEITCISLKRHTEQQLSCLYVLIRKIVQRLIINCNELIYQLNKSYFCWCFRTIIVSSTTYLILINYFSNIHNTWLCQIADWISWIIKSFIKLSL